MSDSAGEHLSPSDIGDSIEGDTPITAPETPDPDAGGSRRDKQQAPFGFGLELEDEATVDVKPSISHEAAEQDRLERVLGPKPGPPDVTGLLLQAQQHFSQNNYLAGDKLCRQVIHTPDAPRPVLVMAHLLAAQTNPLNDGPGCIKAAKTHLDAIAADDPEYPKLDKLRRQLVEVEVKVKKVTDPIDQEFGTVEARQFAHRRMQMRERKRKSK